MSIVELIKKHTPGLVPFLMGVRNGTFKTMDKWPQRKLIKANQRFYKKVNGYDFDINNPVLFTEKIQWYKFFYERSDFSSITDKVMFKDYIRKRLGGEEYVVPMYRAWDNIRSLKEDWNKEGVLPEKFVLKANLQGNGKNIKVITNKSAVSFASIKGELSSWLKVENTLMNSCDRKFYMSKPMILAEKFLVDDFGELRDYKFFCFDGNPAFFKVDYDRFNQHHANYYNSKQELLDVIENVCPPDPNTEIVLPDTVNKMFEIASELSKGFPFIRVDFYSVFGKIYLSEMTFNPGGGFNFYDPIAFNKTMGDMFILPK